MNATRDLIWGIALSLLVHGIFLGLPFSPGGQRLIPTHQSIPLEISFVKLEIHEDAPPKTKPIALTQPERVRQSIRVREKKVTKRREKSPIGLGEKPITSLKEEKTLTPPPAPLIPAPQPKEEGAEKALLASPLPSAENLLEGEEFKASLIPKGRDLSRSRPLTLARPRYDRNPKPPYPSIARRRGFEGVVVLKVEILPNGRVGELRVKRSSGHHILDKSALKTVKRWKFIPAKRGEDPIRIWAEIPIKFKLE